MCCKALLSLDHSAVPKRRNLLTTFSFDTSLTLLLVYALIYWIRWNWNYSLVFAPCLTLHNRPAPDWTFSDHFLLVAATRLHNRSMPVTMLQLWRRQFFNERFYQYGAGGPIASDADKGSCFNALHTQVVIIHHCQHPATVWDCKHVDVDSVTPGF